MDGVGHQAIGLIRQRRNAGTMRMMPKEGKKADKAEIGRWVEKFE